MEQEKFNGLGQLFGSVLNEQQIEIVKTYLDQLKNHDNGIALNHSTVVMKLATQLGILLGIKENELVLLQLSALLHDIGKLGVHDKILTKPDRPNSIELSILQTHPDVGNTMALYHQLPKPIPEVIHTHHIQHDGENGYPKELLGNGPPSRITRIITISDATQVMLTNDRPYKGEKRPLTLDEAVIELQSCAGTQFDPEMVGTFVGHIEIFRERLPELLSPLPFTQSLFVSAPALPAFRRKRLLE